MHLKRMTFEAHTFEADVYRPYGLMNIITNGSLLRCIALAFLQGGYGYETLKDMRKKSLWKTKGNLPAELERLQK